LLKDIIDIGYITTVFCNLRQCKFVKPRLSINFLDNDISIKGRVKIAENCDDIPQPIVGLNPDRDNKRAVF
jgi:hypothetical protein